MTPLLDRVQGELRRRASPPPLLGFLREDEIETLLDEALGEPVDVEVVRRIEHRARTRQRIGLPPFFDRTAEPRRLRRHPTEYPCVRGHGADYCWCVDEALDAGRKISTLKGLRHQASLFHNRRHPPQQPEPEPRRLASVIPFRKRKPAAEPLVPDDPFRVNPVRDPGLDPVFEQRAPLETIEQVAARLGVALYPQPPEGSYPR